MEEIKEALRVIFYHQLPVPTWEILTLLAVVSVCMLLRASRTGTIITYLFTLRLALRFASGYFNTMALMTALTFGFIVLFLGIVAFIDEN